MWKINSPRITINLDYFGQLLHASTTYFFFFCDDNEKYFPKRSQYNKKIATLIIRLLHLPNAGWKITWLNRPILLECGKLIICGTVQFGIWFKCSLVELIFIATWSHSEFTGTAGIVGSIQAHDETRCRTVTDHDKDIELHWSTRLRQMTWRQRDARGRCGEQRAQLVFHIWAIRHLTT